ncbi:MAG: MmgE/PrpD family protein [Rhodospirillaceae bacterium]|nr:MmgE/PrpD family protein [Rhodospirillaceae bacterium]MBT6136556.1 MmgE/PrpD family protein [Rhodospirillaceae bacterium]
MPLKAYAEFCVAAREIDLPGEAMHHAKRCLIDWMAATLPGGILPPAVPMIDALASDIGHGSARLLPSGLSATARTAALINGSAAHTVEFDDIYRDGLYHPGAPVIAAALAAAEAEGVSGDMLLRGIISGYEVSNRIAVAVNPAHYKYWHTTATVGFFGAAAATATILGLDETQSMHAMATTGTMAAGLQQVFRSDAMTKPLHSGRAAEGGLLSAEMARVGITGALDILDGEVGFGNAMSRDVDWSQAVKGLGDDYTITRMTQKNHAACGHVHAAVDGVIELTRAHSLKPEDVGAIRVGSYASSKEICGNPDPKTAFEAKFSLPYCVATALVRGSVRSAAFFPETLADPIIRTVAAKVEHTIDPGCQAAFPKARSAQVEIETTDGRKLHHHAPTRKGDPDAPLTDDELAEKYRELAEPVIGGEQSERLLAALTTVGDLASIRKLPLPSLGQVSRAAAE